MQPNVTPPPLIPNNNRNETLALVHGIYAGLLSFMRWFSCILYFSSTVLPQSI